MLQILQGQVELVRAMTLIQSDTISGVYAATPHNFCIDNSNPANPVRVNSPSLAYPLPALNSDNFSSYGSSCQNIQSRYNVAISYSQATKMFTFTGRWDRLGGGHNQETLLYRISPGVVLAPAPPGSPATGMADILTNPCIIDVLTGACVASPTPTYHWIRYFINYSQNPGLSVVGCRWDWGDGTPPEINNGCNFGDNISHTFPITPGLPPVPAACGTIPYSVVLTMYLSNGNSPTKTTVKNMPACW